MQQTPFNEASGDGEADPPASSPSSAADGTAGEGFPDESGGDAPDGRAALAPAAREAGPTVRRAAPVGPEVRLLAFVIDLVALLILMCPVGIIVGLFLQLLRLVFPGTSGLRIEGMGQAALVGLLLAYSATEVVGSGSPAKFFMDLRVARRDGHTATAARRARRWLVRNLPLLLLAAGVLVGVLRDSLPFSTVGTAADDLLRLMAAGLMWAAGTTAVLLGVGLMAALSPSGLALHDRLTGTSVFRAMDVTADREADRAFQPVMAVGEGKAFVSSNRQAG